jgi:hypothetical protein
LSVVDCLCISLLLMVLFVRNAIFRFVRLKIFVIKVVSFPV